MVSSWGTHLLSFFTFPAVAKSLQSYLTLCDPIDGSPPGSTVPRILQPRTLEWVAVSFSNAWKVKVKSLSRARPLVTPWTAAFQAPPSMGFSRQEYWSGVPLLLQMLSHRMVDIEFFGHFSCSYKRWALMILSIGHCRCMLVNSDGWPLRSSSSWLLSPLQNFLNHHCTVHLLAVPGSNALLMLRVISAALWPILNLNKKITRICFFCNIISLV